MKKESLTKEVMTNLFKSCDQTLPKSFLVSPKVYYLKAIEMCREELYKLGVDIQVKIKHPKK